MASPPPPEAMDGRRRKRRRPRVALKYVRSLRRLGCFTVQAAAGDVAADDAVSGESQPPPSHLVVTVNGIVGSAANWRFAARKFVEMHPQDVVVHCSACNAAFRTLHGVDVMGKRLAQEVMDVVKSRPYLQKISFVAHSLGGLVARYTIALLYQKDTLEGIADDTNEHSTDVTAVHSLSKGKIAGLEPMNFVTFATPHLGSRLHKQFPILRGNRTLEKTACSWCSIAGKSGKHLFLKDRIDEKPPLLLQMATDFGDLSFISALSSFKRRVVYSNILNDYFVGFKTSSIRRQNELPTLDKLMADPAYPHIVHMEKPRVRQEEEFTQALIYEAKTADDMEEAMLKGLNRVPWERVDVNFGKSVQRFFAHSTIQVKNSFLHSAGADVIRHLIDSFIY